MAPPSVPSLYENFTPSPSLLLSPFPSFSDCVSHMSVYSDHNYFFKNMDHNVKDISPGVMSTKVCFDFDIPSSEKSEVMTPREDSHVPPRPVSDGTTEVSDNVFNDVTLVNRLETPAVGDTDFLQGLDEIDFDFDDCEPSRGISLENFIDATLEDTMSSSFNDDNDDNSTRDHSEEEGEDVYKKEFFLKHLRLQRVPSKSTTPRRNRKRKHEDSQPNDLEPCFPHPLSRLETTHPHLHPHASTAAVNNILTRIPSPFHNDTVLTPLSVPSKLCSCASSDWKRTILYSTAKSPDIVSVQTSPSTACVPGIPASSPRCYSDNFSFKDNDIGRLSPSLLLSDRAKDCFEFDLLDKSDMDEDTKDLLQWLDNQEIQTTIADMASQHSHQTSTLFPCRSSSDSSSTSNHVGAEDDLEAILSPKSEQSSWELDRFQDLEAYVSDASALTKENEENVTNIASDSVFPKHQLRLSILADISRDFLNSTDMEKKEAIKMDLLKSCQPNHVSFSTSSQQIMSKQSIPPNDNWRESPLSSLSSSSPFLSPPHSPVDASQDSVRDTQSGNLDLLDLFSDENAVWYL